MHPLDALSTWHTLAMQTTDHDEEKAIVDHVYEALIDQRLAPGTKLSESAMCEAFGVGRMRVRRALLLLSNRQLVDLVPNRGAYVARPTAKQARDIFQARLLIEPSIARFAVEQASTAQLKRLEAHLLKESAAHQSANRGEAIKLSGQFHTALAEMAGNSVLEHTVKDLVTRSSLIIGMFGHAGVVNCRDDEHAGLVQAFRSGDANLAHDLMALHITHIKDHLELNKTNQPQRNLTELFKKLK